MSTSQTGTSTFTCSGITQYYVTSGHWSYHKDTDTNSLSSSTTVLRLGYNSSYYRWCSFNFSSAKDSSSRTIATLRSSADISNISLKFYNGSTASLSPTTLCGWQGATTGKYDYKNTRYTTISALPAESSDADTSEDPAENVIRKNSYVTVNVSAINSYEPANGYYLLFGCPSSDSKTASYLSLGTTSNWPLTSIIYTWTQYKYTLSYSANGGSGAPSSQEGSYGKSGHSDSLTISSTTPTRTGYTFKGWGTSSSSTSASYSSGGSITITKDTTLYAVWAVNSYDFSTSVSPQDSGSVSPSSGSLEYGKTQSLTATASTGYVFSKWSVSGTGASLVTDSNSATLTMGSEAATVTATFAAKTFILQFKGNEPTGMGTASRVHVDCTVKYNATNSNTLTIPALTGHTFLGYYDAASNGNQVYDSSGKAVSGTGYWTNTTWTRDGTNNTTIQLYAHWKVNTYTLTTSVGAGGTMTPNSGISITYGEKITLTATPSSGYVFSYFSSNDVQINEAASGDAKSYSNPSTFNVPANDVTIVVAFKKCGAHLMINGKVISAQPYYKDSSGKLHYCDVYIMTSSGPKICV